MADSTVDGIYSVIPWLQSPPPNLQLRPLWKKDNVHLSLISSLYETDVLEEFADTDIVSILVYFNSFLQGIKIRYRNEQTRSVGNLIGASDEVHLNQERIFAIALRERRQQVTRSQLSPDDLICIEGIQFGLVRWQDEKPQVRYSPCFGSPRPFGPFVNNHRGLWHPHSGGSADWSVCFPSYVNKIFLQPGTSFAGLYADSSTTHIHRLGIPMPGLVLLLQRVTSCQIM